MRSLRGARATASLRGATASLRVESIAEPRPALPAARVSPVVLRLPIVPEVSGRGLVEPGVSGRVLVDPVVSAPVAAGLRVLPGAWALLDPLSVAPCELIEPLGLAGCGAVVERAGSDGLGLVVVLWACTKPALASTATAIAALVAVFMDGLLKWLTKKAANPTAARRPCGAVSLDRGTRPIGSILNGV